MLEPVVGATYITASIMCQSLLMLARAAQRRLRIAPVCSRPTTKARAAGKLPHRFPRASEKNLGLCAQGFTMGRRWLARPAERSATFRESRQSRRST
jgi:hypothetical protein